MVYYLPSGSSPTAGQCRYENEVPCAHEVVDSSVSSTPSQTEYTTMDADLFNNEEEYEIEIEIASDEVEFHCKPEHNCSVRNNITSNCWHTYKMGLSYTDKLTAKRVGLRLIYNMTLTATQR